MLARAFLLGAVILLVIEALVAFAVVQNGFIDPRADNGYLPLEKWGSRSVFVAIRRNSAGLESPIQPTDDNLVAGVKIYAAKCAICHGASDAKASDIAKGLYIQPPQLAKDGVEDDPVGETYYKVKHGMRLTPMPAFSQTLTDDQVWQVAEFLKTMDKLPPAADAEWKKISSQANPANTASPVGVPASTPTPNPSSSTT